jgi:hypothetical protein
MKTGAFLVAAILAFGAAPALAQVRIEAKPPTIEPQREVIPPGLDYEMTRRNDAYPPGPRVLHDPAFIEPFTADLESGQVGFSAWTAPNTPVGASVGGYREVTGWAALGLTITWGGPPPARVKRPAR